MPGEDHFLYATDLALALGAIERFTTGRVSDRTLTWGTSRTDIVTMGRFDVVVDGTSVPTSAWGSKRARTLLKRLVVARGQPVTRDELIELLWPDGGDVDRLGARLSVQLCAVRRILRGGVIADRSSVRLDLDHVDVDIERWFALTDDAAIVAGFHGELLPDDRYEDWSAPLREEIRARFVRRRPPARGGQRRDRRDRALAAAARAGPVRRGRPPLGRRRRSAPRAASARRASPTRRTWPPWTTSGSTRPRGTSSCTERRGGIRKDFQRVRGARSHHDHHHRCHHRLAPVGPRRPGRPPLLLEPPGHREGRGRRFGLRTRARRVRRAARVRAAAAPARRGGRADVRPRRRDPARPRRRRLDRGVARERSSRCRTASPTGGRS